MWEWVRGRSAIPRGIQEPRKTDFLPSVLIQNQARWQEGGIITRVAPHWRLELATPEPLPTAPPTVRTQAASKMTAHHQGVGTRRLQAWSSETCQKRELPPSQPEQAPRPQPSPGPESRKRPRKQSHTHLWEALSPPSPHPPLREDERRGRRKERQEREAGE